MAVFLKILTIIGISFAGILGTILLLIFLVLFVPIRYSAKGYYQKDIYNLNISVSWLLHIVSAKYLLKTKRLNIRIFGFRVKSEEEKQAKLAKKERNIKKNKKNNNNESNVNNLSTQDLLFNDSDVMNMPDCIESVDKTKSNIDFDKLNNIKEQNDIECQNEIKTDGQSDNADNTIKKKQSNKYTFYDKIKKYIDIIETKEFKSAIDKSKKSLKKLYKIIVPKKMKIEAELGFEDPSLTGKILSYYGLLYPFIGKNIIIKGNFLQNIVEVKGSLKGHIPLFNILIVAISLYFNKDIKKTIKMFKEV